MIYAILALLGLATGQIGKHCGMPTDKGYPRKKRRR